MEPKANEFGIIWTNIELRQTATKDYVECRKCGQFPDWVDDLECMPDQEWRSWANEYMMSVDEFKKYVNYFLQCMDGVL